MSWKSLYTLSWSFLLTICCSTGQDPQQLTEQVLSIYPILEGQKANSGDNSVPSTAVENQSTEIKAAPAPGPATSTRDNLIDFGGDGTAAEAPQPERPAPVANPAVESTGEISGLLKATGKPAEGPLLDFTHDMKKTVPETEASDTTKPSEDLI